MTRHSKYTLLCKPRTSSAKRRISRPRSCAFVWGNTPLTPGCTCIRQDTAKRHCGKTLWQGNAASAAERLSRRHCGFSCSKALRQNTAAGTSARRHHDKTLRQKYTAARNYDIALWQETATCNMELRHGTAAWHCD